MAVHVDRVLRRGVNGANYDPTTGGGGAGLRALSYTLSAPSAGGTYDLGFQVVDENGDDVAASVGVRFDVFDDYAPNSGISATCLVKGVTLGTLLNTSNGVTSYALHIGTTDASGRIAFQAGPSFAAFGAQRYAVIGMVAQLNTTPLGFAVVPAVVAFTSTP